MAETTAEAPPEPNNLSLPPMVTEARTVLSHLFKIENRGLWYVCTPNPELYGSAPPSSVKTFVSHILETSAVDTNTVVLPAMETLEKAVNDIFMCRSSVLHNTSFWSNFLHTLQFELSERKPIRETKRTCVTSY